MKKDGDVNDSPAVNGDKIVTFPLGIPGFEKYTTYVVYHKEENGLGAYWLESCDDATLTFTLVVSVVRVISSRPSSPRTTMLP